MGVSMGAKNRCNRGLGLYRGVRGVWGVLGVSGVFGCFGMWAFMVAIEPLEVEWYRQRACMNRAAVVLRTLVCFWVSRCWTRNESPVPIRSWKHYTRQMSTDFWIHWDGVVEAALSTLELRAAVQEGRTTDRNGMECLKSYRRYWEKCDGSQRKNASEQLGPSRDWNVVSVTDRRDGNESPIDTFAITSSHRCIRNDVLFIWCPFDEKYRVCIQQYKESADVKGC